jgi:pyruvate dehydrogenase E2 component (dihydrolipoamide acetyltransferase)
MVYEIVIPRLGWSMEEGTFVGWLKKDGDPIHRGDAVFELEGEKASQDVEAVDEGLLRIPPTGPQPGQVLKVGAVIGYLVEQAEEIPWAAAIPSINKPSLTDSALPPPASPSVRRQAREAGVAITDVAGTGPGGRVLLADIHRVSTASQDREPQTALLPATSPSTPSRVVVASPRARRVATELGVDWKSLPGTGAEGRIRECDVRQAASVGLPAAEAAHGGRRIPITSRRRVIAQRMLAGRQQTVPVTLTTRADATNLVNLREQFKSVGGQLSIPSYQDIIIKIVAEVLKRHPLLAGRWEEDGIVTPADTEMNLGMAVDTEQGLLVPVIRNVLGLSVAELSDQSRQLISRARSGQLSAAEMQGSVFTITNLGAFGIEAFTPIINFPESAILGLGAIRFEAIVLDSGQIVARHQLTLSLTFDHRLVDGAPAARFLNEVVAALSNPSASLLRR